MEHEAHGDFRRKLIFRSWHRGTREMDLLMGSFADRYVPEFSENELRQYESVLEQNDPDLYDWVTGKKPAPANLMCPVLERLLMHRYAEG